MRVAWRIFLLFTGLLAGAVVCTAFIRTDVSAEARWAVVAGALAVLTGVLAAWAAMRFVELEEDERRPDVSAEFDVESLYGMILLAMQNRGRQVAYDVRLDWTQPPLMFDSGAPLDALTIASLQPGERLTRHLGGSADLGKRSPYPDTVGQLSYRDLRGRHFTTEVRLSLEARRGELVTTREATRTHYEVQRIPELLQQIARRLEDLRRAIDSRESR